MDEQEKPAQEPGVYYVNGLGSHIQVDNAYMVVNGKRYTVTNVAELVTGMQHMAKQVTDLEAKVHEAKVAKTRRDEEVRTLFETMVDNQAVERSDANEALKELGIRRLETEYTATVTLQVNLNITSEEDADGVYDLLRGASYDVDVMPYGGSGDFDVDNVTVRAVDDVEEG